MRNFVLFAAVALAACGSKSSTPATTSPTPSQANTPASTGPLGEAEFKALHAAPTQNKAPLHGETIDLGGTKAYLSLPAGKGPHPGIVVIHEWWGLNENIEHWADRLATAGYAALAVDLYGGVVATTPDDAMKAMKAVDQSKAIATIKAAFDFLGSDSRIMAPKRAVIGWCFGGGYSLQAALAIPGLDGAIIYYGQLETDPQKLSVIKARVLGVFGNRDKGIPPDQVAKFDAALKQAGVRHEIFQYDAEHAFANPSNPKYDEKSAADAWTHVLAFLDSLKS
ncbi:MAG TPA: dienelactone hydrolase family protein [Kofleriaceae bacterium]